MRPTKLPFILLLITIASCQGQNAAVRDNITRDINHSNLTIEQKIDRIIKSVDSPTTYNTRPEYSELKKKIAAVASQSDSLCNHIDYWKNKLCRGSGGVDSGTDDLLHGDDMEIATKLLIEQKGGDTLQHKIEETRLIMLSQIKSPDSLANTLPLNTKVSALTSITDAEEKDWKYYEFNHMPVIAVMALLSKFKNDARASELIVLNKIIEESETK